MNDKRELIRQKCVEANPEIVELKFGCEAEYNKDLKMRWVYFGPDFDNLDGPDCHRFVRTDGVTVFVNNLDIKTYKIFGRPIRLADVLLVLETLQKNWRTYVHSTFHEFCIVADNKEGAWNLRADDLEKQSDETINFLYELLK
jgi:hypothetical protein